MTRIPPTAPPPVTRRDDDFITQVRRYKLITPLFGGGVDPQQADPVTVVRGTEVRGHLRFWWRATRGGDFDGDLEAMKKAEESIWGSAGGAGKSGPSQVYVVISDTRAGNELRDTEIPSRHGPRRVELGHPSSPYSYVAFPLRSESGGRPGVVRDGVEFTLTLRFPSSLRASVKAAVWAWETFGGIGARTRRGFGSLQCVEVTTDGTREDVRVLNPNEVETSIRHGLDTYLSKGPWPASVPHLYRDFRICQQRGAPNADEAWKYLFRSLKNFRQARHDNAQGRPYGRSKWPEPDAIRDITGQSAAKHSRRRLSFNKFPRAKFGLPIIFQFKDTDINPSDPSQTSLQGVESDRLSSPLILRPLACAGGKAVGVALLLDCPTEPPGGLVLQGPHGTTSVQSSLTADEARQIEPLDGNPDVLQAFLDYLR